MPIVLKSGCLNLLETSGFVQACNGIVLPLPGQQITPWGIVFDNTRAAQLTKAFPSSQDQNIYKIVLTAQSSEPHYKPDESLHLAPFITDLP